MPRLPIWVMALALIVPVRFIAAAEPVLGATAGVVVKANANVILVRPRGPDGQLDKAIALKVRGTSKVFTLTTQKRDGQLVAVQRETEPKDVQPDQAIVAIYTVLNDDLVLLTAIVQAGRP